MSKNLDFKAYNAFNLSHDHKFTCEMGELVPIMCEEVVPGDIWRCNANMFMRLIPQLAPFMHEVNAYIHFFFVPNRLIKDNFEKFITKGFDGKDTTSWSYITAPAGGFAKYSLADYLGLPTGVAGIQVDALPFRGYYMIVNEWYKNENLQTYTAYSTSDGSDTTTPNTIEYRCWQNDYFTGALPFAQRGDPVYLPLGQTAPVIGNGTTLGITDGTNEFGLANNDTANNRLYPYAGMSGQPVGTTNSASPSYQKKSYGVSEDPTKSGLVADLTGATAATVNAVRTAFQVQRWMEKNARGGVRYIEFLLSHFGEKSSDARLQRPEYLGGGKSVVVTSEVLQTSSTDATSPQGNMAGHSFSAQKSMSFERRFEEFGWVYAIFSVLPKTQYQQGVARKFTRQTALDYYFPTFAHLGQQDIKNKEIYAQGPSVVDSAGNPVDEGEFGFVDRFQELRTIPSRVSSDFRDTLDYWTMTRKFANAPQLNANFVVANDVTKRIFSVTNARPCIVDVGFNIEALRKLPKHGTPGLIDHA